MGVKVLRLTHNFCIIPGMTPLLAASVTGHTHIVEYLISRTDLISRKDKIDSLELLGATYVDKKRDMLGALRFWKMAMSERLVVLWMSSSPRCLTILGCH